MSCKNTNKKNTTQSSTSGFKLNSISGVLNLILTAFSIPTEPIAPLPPQLIMVGGSLRPGLSASAIAARITSRRSEAGLPTGDVFADGPNKEEVLETIRAEEYINALQNETVVNVVIPPGVSVTTTGVGNLGAPVISQGATTSMGVGNGIIR